MTRKPPGSLDALDAAEEDVFARIAAAETVGAIVEDYDLSRSAFYSWINRGGNARHDRWNVAKGLAADVHVEIGSRIMAALPDDPTPAQVQRAKVQADWHRWLATVRNREEYAEKIAPSVMLTVGDLHLSALQTKGQASSHARLAPGSIARKAEDE